MYSGKNVLQLICYIISFKIHMCTCNRVIETLMDHTHTTDTRQGHSSSATCSLISARLHGHIFDTGWMHTCVMFILNKLKYLENSSFIYVDRLDTSCIASMPPGYCLGALEMLSVEI